MANNTPPARDQLLTPPTPARVVWPLTADGLDTGGGNALTPLTGNPISTGVGFVGNGIDAKLVGDLPAWAQSATAPLAFHVRAKVGTGVDWREVIATVSTAPGGQDTPKLELAAVGNVVQVRAKSTAGAVVTKNLCRTNWRFEFRAPEQIAQTLVQSLCWLDDTTLIFAVDCGTTNVLYRVDTTTGEYTGRASSTTYDHINSMHADPDGGVWCQCQIGGLDEVVQLDLATSFSTGAITESGRWNTGDVPVSSIAFATLAGNEYVLLSQYASSGTPRIYVFLRSQMAGTVNMVDRVKRFRPGLRVQDLAFRPSDGRIYVTRSGTGDSVDSLDLAAALAGADDASPTLTSAQSPSVFPQGIDFNPSDSRAWVGTEGWASVGDGIGYSALWSSALAGPEENAFLIDFTGSSIEVRMNGRLQQTFTHAASANVPTKLAVGAHPAATSGQTGFLTSGTVRAVALSSAPFTQSQLDALA